MSSNLSSFVTGVRVQVFFRATQYLLNLKGNPSPVPLKLAQATQYLRVNPKANPSPVPLKWAQALPANIRLERKKRCREQSR